MTDTPPLSFPPAASLLFGPIPPRSERHRSVVGSRPLATTGALATMLLLAGCAGGHAASAGPEDSAPATAAPLEAATSAPRLVATYDAGLMVLDASTGKTVLDEPLAGFNRIAAAGDGRHVLVGTSGGFRALDAGAWSVPHGDHDHHYTAPAELTDVVFPATEPGHVFHHGDRTALFDDGSGRATILDPAELGDGRPHTTQAQAPTAHHGLAIELDDGKLLMTDGTPDSRTGITVSGPADASGTRADLARSADCPGIHGAAAAADDAFAFGCEDGMLIYRHGKISKATASTAYGRVGNQAGSDVSAVVLGDYTSDADAVMERPTRVSLTNTSTGTMDLVETGASYSFRSLGRGPAGEALDLGTDGRLRIIDPQSGRITESIRVTRPWKEPTAWQQPRPTLAVQGGIAYVSEPASRTVHLVDLESAKLLVSHELPHVPNELAGIPG